MPEDFYEPCAIAAIILLLRSAPVRTAFSRAGLCCTNAIEHH
ncbi:MAG TPA: hypothetical protein VIQ00_08730 [Chitinophagaceae bacterium]